MAIMTYERWPMETVVADTMPMYLANQSRPSAQACQAAVHIAAATVPQPQKLYAPILSGPLRPSLRLAGTGPVLLRINPAIVLPPFASLCWPFTTQLMHFTYPDIAEPYGTAMVL